MEENKWLQVSMTLIKLKFRLITSQGMNFAIIRDCNLISLKLENMFTFYPQIHFPINYRPRKRGKYFNNNKMTNLMTSYCKDYNVLLYGFCAMTMQSERISHIMLYM